MKNKTKRDPVIHIKQHKAAKIYRRKWRKLNSTYTFRSYSDKS